VITALSDWRTGEGIEQVGVSSSMLETLAVRG
jgi:hypothetical protein